MTTEMSEPDGAASPMGKSVSGQWMDANSAPGTRAVTMETALCAKDRNDLPHAVKKPEKQNWMDAMTQSMLYDLRYWDP